MSPQRAMRCSRRELGVGLGALTVSWSMAACARRDRSAVLVALVKDVVGAMARDLREQTRALHDAILGLQVRPGPQTVAVTRRSFKAAVVAWKRASAFRSGPFAESLAFQRAVFWPTRPSAVRRVLSTPELVDERRVGGLGVDEKGLFALEYLLFDAELGVRLEQAGREADRARTFARELSFHVLGYAERIRRLLGDGSVYAGEFEAAGQGSLSQLVAQSIDSVEIVSGKLARVARSTERGEPLDRAVEGYFSGTSLEIAGAVLAGTKQLYLGAGSGGLSDLVTSVSPAIDRHVRDGFTKAEARLRELGRPLELGLARHPERFRAAETALRELSHTLKVEAESALQV